jgi:hypothetical protein
MSTSIPAVQGTHIYPVTLIDLDLNGNVYYLTDAYKPYTVGSNTYTELGAFLNVTTVDENLRATNGDISIGLAGIPSNSTGSEVNYIQLILDEPIKGGNVTLKRAFMDTNTMELNTSDVYTRFKGVITNFTVDEQYNFLSKKNDYGVTVSVASINTILESKIVGQRTDPVDRQRFFTDKSFDRIPDLYLSTFDFGKEGTNGGNYSGGGGGGGTGGNDRSRNVRER